MSRILLQTTITDNNDDWDITRFSRLTSELRAAGHEVVARNRAHMTDDPILSRILENLQNVVVVVASQSSCHPALVELR